MLRNTKSRILGGAVAVIAAVAMVGCSSSNPTAPPSSGSVAPASGTVVVGSAQFPENEIIAQIYAQALTANGITVETKLSIGQRDVYLAALQDGSINLIPEYSGNLLQFYDPKTTATSSEEVVAALGDALPSGFEVLDPAKAEDKDSYNVTQKFSTENNVTSLADLAGLGIPLKVGGNPELGERPYGIPGLKDIYGVKDVTLVPISDSGGPLTVNALVDGTVDLADIYSTTPAITQNKFVTLADPKNMILAQNVVPLISSAAATDEVKAVLNKISANLTTAELLAMNELNQGDKKESPEMIAKNWLEQKKLF